MECPLFEHLFYVWPDAVGWKNDGSTSFPNIAL